jgi:autotransporter-associated beta strand protein
LNARSSLTFAAILLAVAAPLLCHSNVYSQDTKRGIGAGDGSLANSLNSRWAYDWNYDSPNAYNGEYVPMFWSGGNLNTKINAIKGYSNVNYVLGFNEPERADQANMTVANAINQWGTISNGFAGTNIKLVSPAVSDTASGRAWLDDFMTQVDASPNLVVDEVAFHWYGTVNINNPTGTANSFLNKVDQYHNNYGRNVWVTEFAGIDFGGNYTTEQMNDWNATFLETAIAGLESRSYVTRYAWWNHNNDSRLVAKDSYGLWRPTKVGDNYYSTLMSGDTQDMNGAGIGLDMVYLRGGKFVNDGSNLGNAFGRIYAMSNNDGTAATSQFGGSGDWGMHSWGSVRVEENATLQKIGTNTVNWRNMDLYLDGTLQLNGGDANQGTLWIQGAGTNAQGDGKLVVGSKSTLRLGNAADTAGFSLDYDIDYRGGTLKVDGLGIVLNGDATIFNQSFFEINEDFVMNGAFLGNSPGIVKTGDATLTLNGDNQYQGFTRVNGGTLEVNGTIGGNNVLVNSGGTLSGTGTIASDIVASSGGIVSPGNSPGTLTATDATFRDGSTLMIQLGSLTDFDQLALSGLLTVDTGANLGLSLLDGFMPNVGDEFKVLDFNSSTGTFNIANAPTLAQGNWDFSSLGTNGIISVVAVPEPSSTVALLTAIGLVGSGRRRRRNL